MLQSAKGFFLFIVTLISAACCPGQGLHSNIGPDNAVSLRGLRKGTAVVITGAASRIPQEAALLEQLHLTGWLNDATFISGASSGALNAVVLNAILDSAFSWERYKQILFGITNIQVYEHTGSKLPLNTQPLRRLITRIVKDTLGYSVMGDLPFPSAVSATSIKLVPLEKHTLRFSNRFINEESNPAYNLVDILMASTAIPVVFPPVKIRDAVDFPQSMFLDGGIFDDHIPYEAVLQFQKKQGAEVEILIIVSRKSDSESDIRDELYTIGMRDSKLLEKLGISLQRYSKESFINKLKELQLTNPDLASRTYVYIPDFNEDFPMLNFNTLKDQYLVTAAWAQQNQPVLVCDYIKRNNSPLK